MVKNWLITGGCGFIGTSLIQLLLQLSTEVNIRILDNLSVGTREDLQEVSGFKELKPDEVGSLPDGVELVVWDIREIGVCRTVTQGIDCVVHLAANTGVAPSVENPRSDMEANVVGTFNMLVSSTENNVNKFVFASSGAPVGECIPPIHEELAAHPVSPYGASKLAGEGYCSAFYRTYGLKTISLRFGNVYGPRSKHKSSVVAKFIRQAMQGEICHIYGTGKQTRDFIYIDDLLDAVIKSSEADLGGEVFQIATNKESTVNEIVKVLQRALENAGISLNVVNTGARVGDVMRNFSDTTKAKTVLDWKAAYNLEKGIEKTVRYFKQIQ